MAEFKHWIEPGTYAANPSIEAPVEPIPEDRFRSGDKILCIKTFVPRVIRDGHPTYEGQEFTVRAYLRGYDYVILEEYGEAGVQNAERFELRG